MTPLEAVLIGGTVMLVWLICVLYDAGRRSKSDGD